MNKLIAILLTTIFFNHLNAQITTSDRSLENGLVYPYVICNKSKIIESDINQKIHHLKDSLQKMEMCLGSYGYLQKNNFLQFEYIYDCTGDGNIKLLWYYNLSKEQEIEVKDIFRKDLHEQIVKTINHHIHHHHSKINSLNDLTSFYFTSTGIHLTTNKKETLFLKWETLQNYIVFS